MTKTKVKGLLIRALLFLNISVSGLLAISYLSAFINPAHGWFFWLLGLVMPVLILVNLLFVVFWAIMRKKNFLISLIVLVLGWSFIARYVQVDFSSESNTEDSIKIISYNVRVFDLYNWGENWSFNNTNKKKILKFLQDEEADIICLQEIVSVDTGNFRTLDTLMLCQPAKYLHVQHNRHNKSHHFGIATLSAYPIVYKGRLDFPSTPNLCIFSDIQIETDTIRVYNVHLESLHLGYDDYGVANKTNKRRVKSIYNILRKMRYANIKRSQQAAILSSHISKCQYPVIVCGDFNDIPSSYTYQTIINGMEDAFRISGSGFGNTYVGKLPSFRIDYIFHSPSIASSGFQVYPVEYSDHYPIGCYINW